MLFALMFCIVIRVVFFFIGSEMADNRGQDPTAGGLLGAILGLVGLLIIALIGYKQWGDYDVVYFDFYI